MFFLVNGFPAWPNCSAGFSQLAGLPAWSATEVVKTPLKLAMTSLKDHPKPANQSWQCKMHKMLGPVIFIE